MPRQSRPIEKNAMTKAPRYSETIQVEPTPRSLQRDVTNAIPGDHLTGTVSRYKQLGGQYNPVSASEPTANIYILDQYEQCGCPSAGLQSLASDDRGECKTILYIDNKDIPERSSEVAQWYSCLRESRGTKFKSR